MTEQENDDARFQAMIRDSERNARENPAVQADVQYKPSVWTEAETSALMTKLHGTEADRIDKLIAEANERNKHM